MKIAPAHTRAAATAWQPTGRPVQSAKDLRNVGRVVPGLLARIVQRSDENVFPCITIPARRREFPEAFDYRKLSGLESDSFLTCLTRHGYLGLSIDFQQSHPAVYGSVCRTEAGSGQYNRHSGHALLCICGYSACTHSAKLSRPRCS
jgi:hypothetical protein